MSLERLCACLHSNRCNIYYRYNVSTGDIILCNNGGLGQRSVNFFFEVPYFLKISSILMIMNMQIRRLICKSDH